LVGDLRQERIALPVIDRQRALGLGATTPSASFVASF
jgi:hypothetical protein